MNVVNRYFNWMYGLVCDRKHKNFRKLLARLHSTDFTYTIEMDGNRAEDGVDLRYRFGLAQGIDDAQIASELDVRPCSVLEMMIALCVRCEEHIMDNPDIGDRTGVWFWEMIENLGLAGMDDTEFDAMYVDRAVERMLSRGYRQDGKGGLFIVHSRGDIRSVEIWYQMMWHLDEVLDE